MNRHAAELQALLFWRGEPVRKKELHKLLSVTEEELSSATRELTSALENQGIALVQTEEILSLTTASSTASLIESVRKEELSKDIGKAGAETLAVILYKGPVTRSELDYIRGVNSTFILRNLLIRGLIERIANPNDQRSFLYQATPDLLAHLGVTSATELPDYENAIRQLDTFTQTQEAKENDAN